MAVWMGCCWAGRMCLLLWCAVRLGRLHLPLWRMLLVGGAVGAWQVTAAYLPLLQTAAMQGILLLFALLLAFSCTELALRGGLWLLLLSFLFEALVLALEAISPAPTVLVWCMAAALIAACTLALRPKAAPVEPVTICIGERRLRLAALRDTGHSLRDPLSGSPVLVVPWRKAAVLLPVAEELLQDAAQFRHPAKLMQQMKAAWPMGNPRLIPYQAVGTDGGLLLAVPCRLIWGAGKEENALVAFSPTEFSDGRTFEALAGGVQ